MPSALDRRQAHQRCTYHTLNKSNFLMYLFIKTKRIQGQQALHETLSPQKGERLTYKTSPWEATEVGWEWERKARGGVRWGVSESVREMLTVEVRPSEDPGSGLLSPGPTPGLRGCRKVLAFSFPFFLVSDSITAWL